VKAVLAVFQSHGVLWRHGVMADAARVRQGGALRVLLAQRTPVPLKLGFALARHPFARELLARVVVVGHDVLALVRPPYLPFVFVSCWSRYQMWTVVLTVILVFGTTSALVLWESASQVRRLLQMYQKQSSKGTAAAASARFDQQPLFSRSADHVYPLRVFHLHLVPTSQLWTLQVSTATTVDARTLSKAVSAGELRALVIENRLYRIPQPQDPVVSSTKETVAIRLADADQDTAKPFRTFLPPVSSRPLHEIHPPLIAALAW
jgi:hypothetical protein